MFYYDGKLQYPVRVETPDPRFARLLQQAIGGVEGEIRVCLQYLFQAFGARGPVKYRQMLLSTGTEEIGHIEMLATAVALNLEGSPAAAREAAAAANPAVAAVMGGMDPRQFLSAGMAALASDANGVPFDGSHVYASGNLAADMYANATAEATGRTLACRLFELTDDPGMKDMLRFLIARDTMHQQQWLAVIEELGGHQGTLPIPNSFPQEAELVEVSYDYFFHGIEGVPVPEGRFTQGASLDGRDEYRLRVSVPMGEEPLLAPPLPQAYAETQQMLDSSASGPTSEQ
ncbi:MULTISPECIES: manganese catalase family protein [unclassified Deinococcus]|uniref:manganese catalase family protein n=1 Tax=unclassified Deinococcus TaxID=2623546 RepID=UPI001C2FD14A|nr:MULTISPECIES: manganese catalase family protein [unclassified Deinococcus]MDK2014121.1 manganese catalase family protein [Deinococcus sp. 43]